MNASQPKFPRLCLLLAYGLTWLFWIPVALTRQDYQTSPIMLAVEAEKDGIGKANIWARQKIAFPKDL